MSVVGSERKISIVVLSIRPGEKRPLFARQTRSISKDENVAIKVEANTDCVKEKGMSFKIMKLGSFS